MVSKCLGFFFLFFLSFCVDVDNTLYFIFLIFFVFFLLCFSDIYIKRISPEMTVQGLRIVEDLLSDLLVIVYVFYVNENMQEGAKKRKIEKEIAERVSAITLYVAKTIFVTHR